ncbi:hypothetical protein RFI_16707, partial [Reticulomyxa filosa]
NNNNNNNNNDNNNDNNNNNSNNDHRPNCSEQTDVGRKIKASCLAFCSQILSTLLSMEPVFQSVVPHYHIKLKPGSILESSQWRKHKDKLVYKTLQLSDIILQWANVPPDQEIQFETASNPTDNDDIEENEKKSASRMDATNSDSQHNAPPSTDNMQRAKTEQNGQRNDLESVLSPRQADLQVRRAVSVLEVNRHDMGPAGANILVECLFILVGCIRTFPKYVEILFEMSELQGWLTKLLFNHHYPDTREQVCKALQMLSRLPVDNKSVPISIRLLNELVKVFKWSDAQQPQCDEFFKLLLHVFDHVCRIYKETDTSVSSQVRYYCEEFVKVLKNYISTEDYADPERTDEFLEGTLKLLRLCSAYRLFKDDLQSHSVNELIQYVYEDCLFNVPQQNDPGCKCKSVRSRQAAFALLHSLTSLYPRTFLSLQNLIYTDPIWYHMRPRDLKDVMWKYHPTDEERFPVRYVGLKNQGATCYMNSLLQQLFINEDFRRDILEARLHTSAMAEENLGNEEKESLELRKHGILPKDSVLYQMQLLFGYLMISQKKFYDTMPLCTTLKGYDGNPLPLGEQQDVNEFCNRLFDELEHDLNKTDRMDAIRENFGGYLVSQIISKDDTCDHRSEQVERFLTVSLTVKNKANLRESLDLYVQGDLLDGDNKYFCSQCNTKILALRRVCFKTLPKCLLLHLSRFEFDFNSMTRLKLNSRFEFPMELNMEKYTAEGLAHKKGGNSKEEESDIKHDNENGNDNDNGNENENENESETEKDKQIESPTQTQVQIQIDASNSQIQSNEQSKSTKCDQPQTPQHSPSIVHPPEYYQYRLVGILVHTGGANSGHYYSFGQSSDSQWWEFNDTEVLPFDVNKFGAFDFFFFVWI